MLQVPAEYYSLDWDQKLSKLPSKPFFLQSRCLFQTSRLNPPPDNENVHPQCILLALNVKMLQNNAHFHRFSLKDKLIIAIQTQYIGQQKFSIVLIYMLMEYKAGK